MKISIFSCLQRLGILTMSTSQLLSLLSQHPSQLCRQERRREEALAKADKAVPSTEASSQHSEKEVHEKAVKVMEPFKCDQCGHTASCKEIMIKHIAEKHKETETQDSEPISSNLSFQCDQCDFTGASDKGLKQHTRMKHRISQVDGNDSDSDDCSELIERNCYNAMY